MATTANMVLRVRLSIRTRFMMALLAQSYGDQVNNGPIICSRSNPCNTLMMNSLQERTKPASYVLPNTQMQSSQVEFSMMREISLLQYVKRGINICKTQSALPEVAKQPRMLGRPGGMPPRKQL